MARPSPVCARTLAAALLASTALVGVAPALAQSLPTGGHVVSGGVAIGTPQGGALAITQSSQNAIVNWQGFSIGQGNRVDIQQPNSQAAILNRVTGTTRSTIAGQLNANGQVYLVNPNGIGITPTGQVNAAGFVASTLDIADDDFRAGRRQFRGSGASAKVTNRGAITIARGGYAALIGGSVDNAGTISVPMGKVGLGSGEQATLDLAGDGFLQVAVPTQAAGLEALVRHSGTISADGGSVTLTAAAARDMARQAVNLSGTVEARSVSGRNGRITLSGGDGTVQVTADARLDASGAGGESGGRIRIDGRRLDVAGTVDVSGASGGRVRLKGSEQLDLSGRVLAQGRTGRGGRVAATAAAIATHAALIDASGATGGGAVRLGGGRQGQGRLAHAQTIDIDAAATIRADAGAQGNGGDVVVWSDANTRFAGTISAKGGAQGGDGGQVEVSSKGVLAYDGTTILTAAHGSFGTLLLDPYNITISNGTDSNQSGFTATGNDSVINAGTLQTALASANVTVSTDAANSAGSQAGNITIAAPVTWSSGSLLTLSAANAIAVNAPITVAGGGQLALNTTTTTVGNTTQPLLSFGAGGSVSFAAGQTAQALTLNGTAYTLLRSMADVAGLNNQSGTYALATDLDASGTTYAGAVAASFSGTLEGLGHAVTGLTINAPSTSSVGLIGSLRNGGTVRDLGLIGSRVTGYQNVGSLVGNNNGTIMQAYATGTATGSGTGSGNVGGLVGENNGTITQAYAAGAVSGGDQVGGLVGYNGGTIAQAYAAGTVIGDLWVGGLVGNNFNPGTITQAYATAAVRGDSEVGGFVGQNNGAITQAYATGTVSGSSTVGGLVGENDGAITQAYATGAVSGSSTVGGLVGNNGGTITQAYATGAVSGSSIVGGLVGQNGGSIARAYATGAISGIAFVGGLIGYSSALSTITQTYWNTQTSGQQSGIGLDETSQGSNAIGLTTTQFQSGSASGLGAAFGGGSGGLYPYLTSFFPNGVQAISGTVYKDAGTTVAASGTAGAVTVSLDAAGSRLTQATTGANGYYYVALPAGSLSAGSDLLASTPANAVTGARNSASLVGATGASTQSLDLFGGALTATTTAPLLSGAPGLADLKTRATAAAGSDATATAVVQAVTGVGYLATGTSFTVDQAVTTGGTFLVRTAAGTPLTIAAPITVTDGGSLGLLAGGALRVNAPVQARGAVSVALGYDASDPTNLSFAQGTGLTFLNAEGSPATAAVAGQALTINGNAATLVYTMAQLDAIDGYDAAAGAATATYGSGLGGAYALAGNLTAAGTTYADALVGTNSSNDATTQFSGSFEGLGHAITGLTVSKTGYDAGLFGFVASGGTVRDLGLIDVSIRGRSAGGLAGENAGTIVQAYATGIVSNVDGNPNNAAGGLVGYNYGTIAQAYAIGTVSGNTVVGGLVGGNYGDITQAFAASRVTSGEMAGGLVGWNPRGTIRQSYATGAVSGSQAGGLVGINNRGTAFVSQSYWDRSTTGLATGFGLDYNNQGGNVTGLTTAQFQSGSASHLGAAFAGGTGGLYPYLASFFPNGVQAVSGTVSGVAAPGTVTVLANGQTFATASAGANGYYYAFAPTGTLPAAGHLAASLSGTGANGAATVITAAPAGNAITGLDLHGGWLTVRADAGLGTLSAIQAATDTALGSSASTLTSLPNRQITAAASGLSLDTGLSVAGTLVLAGTGALSQTAGSSLAAHGLILNGWSGVTLEGNANTVGTLAASGIGSLAYRDTASLTVGTLADAAGSAIAGVTTGGTVRLASGGDLTVAAGASVTGTDPVLAATGRFVNQAGVRAVTATSGRWLIYSADPANDTFGGLDSGNTAVWGTGAGGAVAQAGNRYVFAKTPLLTVASTDLTKTYGEDASTALAGAYTVTGFDPGVVGAYRGDTAAAILSGAPTLSSTGGAPRAGVANGPYAVTVAAGSLAASSGYRLAYESTGRLTVTPRTLTLSGTRTYDATAGIVGGALTAGNLVNGDTVTLSGTGALAGKDVGTQAFADLSGLTLSNPNYTLVGATGAVAITPATLTYTADAVRRTYGAANPTLSGTVTGFYGADTLANATSGTLAFATAAGTGSNVGRYAVTGSGLGATNGNYVFVQAAGNAGALTIDPAPLTVTGTRTYDATTGFGTGQLVLAGGVNGETLTLTAGTSATAAADAGTYAGSPLTGLALAVSGGNGLAANYALPATGALTITPAPIVVTARSGTSVYGDTPADPGLAATGLQGGQGVSALTGLANSFGLDTASAAGTYALSVTGALTNPNYVVTATQAGRFIVDRRPITVTADAQSRTYGDANPALTYTVGGRGLVDGDALSGNLATTATTASGVGTYAIGQGSLTASPNYAVRYVGADISVTPRTLTLSGTRTYDATAGIAGSALAAGNVVNGDSVVLSGSGTLGGRDVGTWGFADLSGLTLANANYTLAGATGSVVVTPAPVVVTARSDTSIYGDTPTDPGLAATGLQGGQDVSVLTGLANSFGVTARTGVADGPVALTVAGSLANPNYVVTARQNGTWTVTPRPLVVTPDALARAYGDATPDRGAASGDALVNGDTLGSVALRANATAGSDVGRYDLGGSNVVFGSGTAANYAVTYATRPGGLVVVPRGITVTADAQSRTYGDANPLLTYTTTALGAGQALVGGLGTDATNASGVGAYAITQGTLATANANYAIAYRGADLTVTPRTVTLSGSRGYDATAGIAGSALTAGNRVDGDVVMLSGSGGLAGRDAGTWGFADLSGLALSNANYTLVGATGTVTITPATITVRANDGRSTYGDTPTNPGLSATGLVGGQDVSVLTGLASGFGLDARSAAGSYTLTVAGSLANPNYRIGAIEAGTYTIDRRPITVTADAQSRTYGDANPALTYTVGGRGLVDGDALSGSLATDADAASAPGLYPILQGTLAAGPNYSLGYRGADITVQAIPVRPNAAAPDATGLASTAERAVRQDGWPRAANLPFLTRAGGAGIFVADPRFDATLVCTGHQGGCFSLPLAPRPGPQAAGAAASRR